MTICKNCRKEQDKKRGLPLNEKPSEYSIHFKIKGVDETFLEGVKEGGVFYTVCLAKGEYIDVTDSKDAEILSRLVRIENKLKKN